MSLIRLARKHLSIAAVSTLMFPVFAGPITATHASATAPNARIVTTTYTGIFTAPSSATFIHPYTVGVESLTLSCTPASISYGQSVSCSFDYERNGAGCTVRPSINIYWYDGWTTTDTAGGLVCGGYKDTVSHNYYARGTAKITASAPDAPNAGPVLVVIS
jgi:hypothetical protein